MANTGSRKRTSPRVEPLERRTLLAHVGLDLGFGHAGYAPVDGSLLVAPLAGGKVLAVGALGAVRLHPDGTLDPVFVDRGAKSDVPREAYAAAVAGQQLFIAGVTRTALEQGGNIERLFVRKVNLRTGGTGAGFGTNGLVVFDPVLAMKDVDTISFGPASMIPTADGGVIIAVTQWLRAGQTNREAIVLHKLDAAGRLDAAFGSNGVVTVTITEDSEYLAVGGGQLAAYPDGRFVLVGGMERDATLHRFNPDGSPDTTFGDQGIVALDGTPFNSINLSFSAPLVQPDGKIVLGSTSADISLLHSFASLTRFNADGTRDLSFGSGNTGNVPLGREEGSFNPSEIALDAAGRIIGVRGDAQLYRLTPAGDLDATFDDDGLTTIPQAPGAQSTFTRPADLAIDFAGNVLYARMHVARFADNQQRVDLGADRVIHIDGTDGADTITAALAGDTITVTFNAQPFTFAADSVAGFLVTAAGGDDVIDLAAVAFATATINAGDGNDSLRSGDARDRLNGDAGDDTIHAGGGKDLIFGGDGGDSIWGDGGDDHAFGEYGNDSLSGGDGNDRLYGGHTYLLENDEYTSTYDGDDSLSGNAGNDRCSGQSGNDRVAGNGGRDRLFGGDGQDRLLGGTSGDWLYGDNGADQFWGEGGNDRLYGDYPEGLSLADTLHGGAGDDLLVSRDDDPDELFGDRGRDTSIADEDDVLASIESRT